MKLLPLSPLYHDCPPATTTSLKAIYTHHRRCFEHFFFMICFALKYILTLHFYSSQTFDRAKHHMDEMLLTCNITKPWICDVNTVNSVCNSSTAVVSEGRPQTASPLCPTLHKRYATEIPQETETEGSALRNSMLSSRTKHLKTKEPSIWIMQLTATPPTTPR